MITAIVSVAGFALLFAVYGALRPRAGCGAACTTCTHSCERSEPRHDHV